MVINQSIEYADTFAQTAVPKAVTDTLPASDSRFGMSVFSNTFILFYLSTDLGHRWMVALLLRVTNDAALHDGDFVFAFYFLMRGRRLSACRIRGRGPALLLPIKGRSRRLLPEKQPHVQSAQYKDE